MYSTAINLFRVLRLKVEFEVCEGVRCMCVCVCVCVWGVGAGGVGTCVCACYSIL